MDDVVDVLMADGDRPLRVMLEEEMGFRLEENEHPLIQGLGAGFGALIGAVCMLFAIMCASEALFLATGAILFGLSAYVTSKREHNKVIPAIFWNIGIGLFSYLVTYFFMQFTL